MKEKRNKSLLVLTLLFSLYCMFFSLGKYSTYAWFSSEIRGSGSIINGNTEDFLLISPEIISYENDCTVKGEILITNISDLQIPIQLEEVNMELNSGESFMYSFKSDVSCDSTEINFHILGFTNFIDENITIPLDSKQLVPVEEVDKEEDKTEIEKPIDEPSDVESSETDDEIFQDTPKVE